MTFLTPYLLGALALAAAPLIIHLLNRRRFQLVEWAPMKYLKLTIKTNRRRLRIEQLLLLALRTLLIVVLVLAIARPAITEGGFGGIVGGKGRVSRILVIDDSLSMGYQTERRSAFDLAKQAVGDLLAQVGPQDSVTAIVTSAADQPLVREIHLDTPAKLTDPLARLQPSDVRSDWAATFKSVDGLLETSTFPTREVVVITDLRRSGWSNGVTELANRWAGKSVTLKVIDVGSRATENASILSLSRDDAVALPSAPANLHAQVRNQRPSPMTGAQATLEFAGGSRPIVLPEVPSGQTATLPLSVTPQAAGHHPLRLSIPPDALAADDARWLSLTVRSNIDIALIDGELSARAFESETDFLALSFTAGSPPWEVRRMSDTDWLAARPTAADVTIIANVATLSPERVAALERMVAAGMGLIIFPGELVDTQLYNDRLYKDGAGLLPARLGAVVDGPVTGLVVEPSEQSSLAPLTKIAPAALQRIVAKRYLTLEAPRTGAKDATRPTRVLARWNDSEARPVAVEKQFGRGRVVLWSLTADKQWSDWPVEPTYVLAMRSAVMAVARPDGGEAETAAGQPIRFDLPEGQEAIEPRVTAPGGEPEPAIIEKHEAGPTTLKYARTAKAGIYAFSWKDPVGKDHSRAVAVNPDKAESELEPIAAQELTALLGDLHPPVIRYVAGHGIATGPGKEIWRTLAWIVITMAVVETIFAVWVGRER